MCHEEIANKLIEKARMNNILVWKTEKSHTSFGESWYISLEGLANFTVRISDHVVGLWRSNEPQMYTFDKNIDNVINNIIDNYFKSLAGINKNCFYASTREAKLKYFQLITKQIK